MITHWRSLASAFRVWPIAGRPTFTTEPSIMARLEARMVVIRTSLGRFTVDAGEAPMATAASHPVWAADVTARLRRPG